MLNKVRLYSCSNLFKMVSFCGTFLKTILMKKKKKNQAPFAMYGVSLATFFILNYYFIHTNWLYFEILLIINGWCLKWQKWLDTPFKCVANESQGGGAHTVIVWTSVKVFFFFNNQMNNCVLNSLITFFNFGTKPVALQAFLTFRYFLSSGISFPLACF